MFAGLFIKMTYLYILLSLLCGTYIETPQVRNYFKNYFTHRVLSMWILLHAERYLVCASLMFSL